MIHLLERHFKSEQNFNEYLDQTYDPNQVEQSFTQFLNSLADHGLTSSDKSN